MGMVLLTLKCSCHAGPALLAALADLAASGLWADFVANACFAPLPVVRLQAYCITCIMVKS